MLTLHCGRIVGFLLRNRLRFGENEVKAHAFAVKNLATGVQVSVPRAELAARVQG